MNCPWDVVERCLLQCWKLVKLKAVSEKLLVQGVLWEGCFFVCPKPRKKLQLLWEFDSPAQTLLPDKQAGLYLSETKCWLWLDWHLLLQGASLPAHLLQAIKFYISLCVHICIKVCLVRLHTDHKSHLNEFLALAALEQGQVFVPSCILVKYPTVISFFLVPAVKGKEKKTKKNQLHLSSQHQDSVGTQQAWQSSRSDWTILLGT